ncbi:diacylglycerol/lipid kinase family protein [Ponticoccus litoralis]|uniref:Diacylglycerol kinase family protein n=1 Tax=Ponticoccus litoralis TaxID=422297 RepID=A0AAW9SSH0_9RHOB
MLQSPDLTAAPAAPASSPDLGRIAVIANRKSGTNARDNAAIGRAMKAFGAERARRYSWTPGKDPDGSMRRLVETAIREGAQTVVSAGGDGTAMAVAQAALDTGTTFAALPLGTFNYFARGLGLPEEAGEAAAALMRARRHRIRVGMVNGKLFLNNASLGIYPAILKQRESVYARYGRHRIMAHWSVAKTFLRFQRPMHLALEADGSLQARRTPLLFVSRSAFQLERFGLSGAEAISDDSFAVLVGRGDTRADLFRTALRMVTRTAVEGRDYDFIAARSLTVDMRKSRALVAYDGEKSLAGPPFDFRMSDRMLNILIPEPDTEDA